MAFATAHNALPPAVPAGDGRPRRAQAAPDRLGWSVAPDAVAPRQLDAVRWAVVGTVMYEPILLALRRLGRQHLFESGQRPGDR